MLKILSKYLFSQKNQPLNKKKSIYQKKLKETENEFQNPGKWKRKSLIKMQKSTFSAQIINDFKITHKTF